MALGPKTDNAITDGDGNVQVGHNAGTITSGYTPERHEQLRREAVAEKTADLERAHGAEKDVLLSQINDLRDKLENIDADYVNQVEELTRLKSLIARSDNQISQQKRDAAFAAIDLGETTLAQALLKELAKAASLRREDAAMEEAEFEFELGKLAEDAVRWQDAYTHYKRAVALHETPDHLMSYARITWRLAKGEEAVAVNQKLLDRAKAEFGDQSREYASRLNGLALVVKAQGRYAGAEGLFREALAIGAATIGTAHPNYVIRLNNLAGVVQAQGRYAEAEELYREALAVTLKEGGTTHPVYANSLNNLGVNLAYQEKYAEALDLLTQALAIRQATLPADHPDNAQTEGSLAA